MKRSIMTVLLLLLAFSITSWGVIGHKTVAAIAQAHLSPTSRSCVRLLLAEKSIVDVAFWGDEEKKTANYKLAENRNYLKIAPGKNFEQFAATVKAQGTNNLYGAILKCRNDLNSVVTTNQEKICALKLLIRLIGDAHQPMCVSGAEIKTRNSSKIIFNGKEISLNSFWDDGVINKHGLSFTQMAKAYDTATPAQIKLWQADEPMKWLWESYQIGSKIYTDAEKSNKVGDTYYKDYLPIVQQRIEQGGIRLAGVLNDLYKNGSKASAPGPVTVINPQVDSNSEFSMKTALKIDAKDMGRYIDKNVYTIGKVVSIQHTKGNKITLLNINNENPNQDFIIMIKAENRNRLGKSEIELQGKTITIQGFVDDYNGKPAIELLIKEQLQIVN